LGHTGGLPHETSKDKRDNLMMQAFEIQNSGGEYSKSTNLTHDQIKLIRDNYINNKLNSNSPKRSEWFRKYLVK